MLDLWYKNAIIYCLDVETFMDSNGDGAGDFRGLTDRLDHLEALGVTAIWLNPFYPSPNRDNGYDVSDFFSVEPRLGNLGDFVEFARAASERGIRVIVDLVVNHTSIDHPWFQSARACEESPYRDWYIWSKEKPEDIARGVIFPGSQQAVWTYDETAGAWYMHRFFKYQPDLNLANPQVREQIHRIMGFWLALGVWGFRVDAVPFLIEYNRLEEEPDRDPHRFLSQMREFLSWRRAGAVLLAEANVPYDQAGPYFGGVEFGSEERMHMILDFPLNQRIHLALVRGEAAPIAEALRARPRNAPEQAQWAVFLRNHDELALDRLSEAERQEVFGALAPDKGMRIYDRGIRRRLAPMHGQDPARLALAHSLLFALPGTPVMWYGDEIGMGEDLSLNEREAVRTPMQWADEPNGGFSRTGGDLARPVVKDGPHGYPQTNVALQREEATSLLSRVQQLIRARRACPEIGWGEWEILDGLPGAVLGLTYSWRGGRVVTLHNLGGQHERLLPQIAGADRLTPLLGHAGRKTLHPGEPIELDPYGYRWFRINGERG